MGDVYDASDGSVFQEMKVILVTKAAKLAMNTSNNILSDNN